MKQPMILCLSLRMLSWGQTKLSVPARPAWMQGSGENPYQ